MGLFSYECRFCRTSIRISKEASERVILFHIQNYNIVGVTTGEYNGYGGVKEDPVFGKENNSPNSAGAIHKDVISGSGSGISAYHCYCFDRAKDMRKSIQDLLIPSQYSDNQGRAKIRKNYCRPLKKLKREEKENLLLLKIYTNLEV